MLLELDLIQPPRPKIPIESPIFNLASLLITPNAVLLRSQTMELASLEMLGQF